MDYEKLTREELVGLLQELTLEQQSKVGRRPEGARLLHELQVHQIELEMQNRELREAQGQLEESRNRYADLYDFAPVAYCTLNARGAVEELNLTAASLFGCEREQALGRPLTVLVRFENPPSYWHHLGACTVSTEPVISEFRLIVDDRIVHVEAVSVPVLKLDLQARAFRTAFTDITRRKRAEWEREVAYGSEQRLRNLLEALDRGHIEAGVALMKGGPAGLLELLDVIARNARHVTQADAAQVELRQLAEQFGPFKAQDADAVRSEAHAVGTDALSAQLGYGGRVLADLTVTRVTGPFPGDAERALRMLVERLGSSLEIARLRTLEARETLRLSLLERVERRLRSVQEVEGARAAMGEVAEALIPDFAEVCVVHLIRDGALQLQRIVHADATRQLNLAKRLNEEPLRHDVLQCLCELARAREPHLLRLTGRPTSSDDAPYARLTHALETSSLIVAPLWARDRLLGVLCFGREGSRQDYDLALLMWAQEIAGRCASALDTGDLVHELREAVQWRENLMAMISHDLKSPLSAISLSALSMAPEMPQVERRSSHKQVDLIRRSAEHMHHMINDLLSASLLEAGSFRVDLRRESAHELVEEACQLVEPLLKARALRLERTYAGTLPFVFADREPILRVFSNLLGNAAKFTPRGGRIRVGADHSDDGVVFCISDSGPGIPPEQRGRLFERYWKGRKGGIGLGLGLYISKAIVEAHDGRIWLESGAEEGATFCFELRRCEPSH